MAETQAAAKLGEFGAIVAGETLRAGLAAIEVRSPFDGALVAVARNAGPAQIERAIAAAAAAFARTRVLPSWKRAAVLETVARQLEQRRDELATIIALEAGKPIRTARLEVDRAAFTFKVGAEEARRIHGEILALDWLPGTEGREGHVRRVPLGPIAGITPFNFPLLLVAHKMAPAIAAGNPIIIKPAAIAGAILCATSSSGKLNGVMPAIGPSGTRRTCPSRPSVPGSQSSARISP